MSAKKRAPAQAKKSAAPSNRKSSDHGQGGKSSAAEKPAATTSAAVTPARAADQQTLSNKDIGEAAGEIWSLLAESDGQTLAALKKSVGAPADVVVAAVGWLAREDKLLFDVSGRTTKISLKH